MEDDLGTRYDASAGGLGAGGGDREIHPAPPASAATLALVVGTPRVTPEGEPAAASRVVNRVRIDLLGRQRVP